MTNRTIRPATPRDATDIAAIVDMAGEGLPAYIWGQIVDVGQSSHEIGRTRAMRPDGAFSYRNTHIAEIDGVVAGAVICYPLGDPVEIGNLDKMHEIGRPLALLEAEAPGHCYVTALAVYPEFRRRGVGRSLLKHADAIGRDTAPKGMTIIVASENIRAKRLYEEIGYRAKASRPLIGFPGFKRGGEWVLMTKAHS